MRDDVLPRDVREDDLATFFDQQLDPVATAMGDFVVAGRFGPLRDGEIERARAWGPELVRALA